LLQKRKNIAIIGGGVAGSTVALQLGSMGISCTLFEKEKSLISGPPFCHLHAGGNLYREISDAQCVTLLRQSIDFLRYYPFIVDYRPTVIAIPIEDKGNPKELLPRLELLVDEYKALVLKDPDNKVLGEPDDYFRIYDQNQIESLKEQDDVAMPQNFDEWMISVAKHIDINRVKFPLILVQEYGLNLFRLASGVTLLLEEIASVKLMLESKVTQITQRDGQWEITSASKGDTQRDRFDYLINATGFRTGVIDDMLNIPCKKMVEFKAAYISKWDDYNNIKFPEIIFHGERGTPQGMGQFTPYPGGYFQLHGMTKDITLYEDGLVSNSRVSCQPKLGKEFMKKIEKDWQEEEIAKRTHAAIEHISQLIPSFSTATVGSKPLFGAQQIPGDDPTLRVAEVSFPKERYARCEIVKVSSVVDMLREIIKDLKRLCFIENTHEYKPFLYDISKEELNNLATEIATSRQYPKYLATLLMPKQDN
jgi:hypothetical protein